MPHDVDGSEPAPQDGVPGTALGPPAEPRVPVRPPVWTVPLPPVGPARRPAARWEGPPQGPRTPGGPWLPPVVGAAGGAVSPPVEPAASPTAGALGDRPPGQREGPPQGPLAPGGPWLPPVVGAAGGAVSPPVEPAASPTAGALGDQSAQREVPRRRATRSWLAVAAVAALVGAGVGAGVTALSDQGGPTVTVSESDATPGAATLGGDVSIPTLLQRVLPAVVSIDVTAQDEEDQGTGMIISPSGEVVTNNHVIALAESGGTITVTRSGTTEKQPATLIGADPVDDMALLQIKGASGLPAVTLGDSNKAAVGDAVVAIGNALGLAAGTPTVTQGIVSALGRTVTASDDGAGTSETLTNMIQTDAAINPGNSGGPLIDTAGQVIGMDTAVAGGTGEGTQAQNIGFAIPSAEIESVLPELAKGGTVRPGGGALGVTITTLTPQLRQQYGFTPTSGAVILSVLAGSPAELAGLREGDVIVAVETTKVTSAQALVTDVATRKAGTQAQLTVYVGDLRQTFSVTLETQAQEQLQQTASSSNRTTTSGTTATSGVSPFGALAP